MTYHVTVTMTYEEYISERVSELLRPLIENQRDLRFDGSNITIDIWFDNPDDAMIFKMSI